MENITYITDIINFFISLIKKPLTDPSGIATILTGAVAIYLYKRQIAHEKRNAAITLVLEIRQTEQKVSTILHTKIIKMERIPFTGNWDRYKHFFSSDLSYDDFALFNRFFESILNISDASQKRIDIHYAGLTAKAATAQELLLNISKNTEEEYKIEREKIISLINKEEFLFQPDDPLRIIIESIEKIEMPSTTLAFSKLREIAKLG